MTISAFLPPRNFPFQSPSPTLRVHTRRTFPTCAAKPSQPSSSSSPPKISRRAFTALLLAALPLRASASATEELLDQDLDVDTAVGVRPPTRFDWEREEHEEREESNAGHGTPEEYEQARRIEGDTARTYRVFAARAGVVGFVAAYTAIAMSISERESLRIKLPTDYDPKIVARYFQHRPDKVLFRMMLFAKEIAAFSIRLASDIIAERVQDAYAVQRGTRPLAWATARAEARDKERAVLLREALIRLGPAVIKLGQAAASRRDLFGVNVIRELQELQDNILAYFPASDAFKLMNEELGARPSALFDNLSPEPVAGASLGMVFKASIDGTPVAVKVQRPEVAESIALDCYIVRSLAHVATVLLGSRTDFRQAVDEYSSRLFEELDYTNELKNLTKFRELYGHLPDIYLPKAFPNYCSRRVLVLEWVDGEKLIDDQARVRAEDIQVVETGIRFALTQLLDKGFLHADMHNGNMLRTKSGYLAFIDFGLVAEVPAPVRQSLVCALMHLIHGEYNRLAECFAGMSLMSSEDIETDLPLLSEALRDAFEPSNEALAACRKTGVNRFTDFTLVGAVGKLINLGPRFPFVFNDYFLNNLRCLGMLEGLALNADPKFNVLGVVYPYVINKILSDPAPRYQRALESLVIDAYGRMRWSRMDQLLRDVEDTAAVSILAKAEPSTALGFSKSELEPLPPVKQESVQATIVKEEKTRKEKRFSKKKFDEEHSPALVLRFITSKSGRFVRQYIIQRYMLDLEMNWRNRIDKLASRTKDEGLKDASPKEGGDGAEAEALNRRALQATARELSDDEARIRTRQFFRQTPLTQRLRVLFRVTPSLILPLTKLFVKMVTYFVQVLVSIRRSQRMGRKKAAAVGGGSVTTSVVNSNEVERWSLAGKDKEGEREWSPFDSSFLRRTQSSRLGNRAAQSTE